MRNIAVFIGNRADAGPLGPVIKALNARPELNVNVVDFIAGSLEGMAAWAESGSRDMGRGDIALLLGDRYELLTACQAALLAGTHIAHIHGGETTLGSFDDRVRNAVSQLATIHFTAAEVFSEKLRSMKVPGEIFTVGPPGLDDLETDDDGEYWLLRQGREKDNLLASRGHFLVCLHPDTTQPASYNYEMATQVALALGRFPGRRVIAITPNDDPGSASIRNGLAQYHDPQFVNLPRRRYLTALKHAAVCIGNSSSFVIEAPALRTPSVIVGERQDGRPMAKSVSRVLPDADCIEGAIKAALLNGHHFEFVGSDPLPYGRGGASAKIAEILASR